jgi:F-type H+-transporting ATPase subunit b
MMVLQAIPFLVTLAGLHLIIFKPMLAMLAEREKNIHGFKREAELLQEEVSAKVTELETRLVEARAEASAERAKLRQEAAEAEGEILAAARAQADQLIGEARARIAEEREIASTQLRSSADTLSQQIAGAVLGRPVGGKDN